MSSNIWFKDYTVEYLEGLRNANMGEHIGIHFVDVGPDFLKARMPVDKRTTQPFGIMHGGASCVLSETLGSVGLELNINHIRAVTAGHVIGTCTPLHTGRRTQVWQTDITEEVTGKRVAISRLTLAIIEHGTLSAQKNHVVVERKK
jgi:1,4-dihydroxy-2-naphthoyl-CoA hydrolase